MLFTIMKKVHVKHAEWWSNKTKASPRQGWLIYDLDMGKAWIWFEMNDWYTLGI